MKNQEQEKAAAFNEAGEAWIGAFRALAEQGVRAASEGVEAFGKEAGLMFDAASTAVGAGTPEEAARAVSDYFNGFASRATASVRSVAEAMPRRFADATAPFEAAAARAFTAFRTR